MARLDDCPGDSQESSSTLVSPCTAITTANSKDELLLTDLCFRTSSSIPEGSMKAKGDYNPLQTHIQAAKRMFKTFGTESGKPV